MAFLIHIVFIFCIVAFQLTLPALADDKPWLIPKDARFRPDGKVVIDQYGQSETGTYNGVKYRFWFKGGHANFAGAPGNTLDEREHVNWDVVCKKDPINDTGICFMHLKGLFVFVTTKGNVFVSVGSHHYPGSGIAIRINSEPPFVIDSKTTFDLGTSARIIERLKTNPQVVTRYQKWPKSSPTDNKFQVFGFPETYEYINWAVQQIK